MPLSFLLDPTSSQSAVEWYRLKSPRFTVYADKRAEKIARYGLLALEEAYGPFSILLGVHLENEAPLRPVDGENLSSSFERIPVIIGTAVDGGGFANPVTQNIELKIAGGSHKGLFQHELTHRLMYEHLDLSIGPGGRVFTLAMTPTWWIEGLPELLTESVGRLQTAGVGRSMVLHKAFPDWDRLHALYQLDSYDDYLRGYVTSGLFFGYLASDERVGDLFELHRDYFWKTLTPPFVTAEDFFFYAKFGLLGSSYYKEFQNYLSAQWERKLRGLVSLSELEFGPPLFVSESTPRIDEVNSGYILSDLSASGFPSSLEFRSRRPVGEPPASKLEPARRIPFAGPGSTLTEVREYGDERSFVWSLIPKRNNEGRRRYELFRARINGDFASLEKVDSASREEWNLEAELGESLVSDFLILDEERILLLTNTFGANELRIFDSRTGAAKILASFEVPEEVAFVAPIPGRDLQCVSLLVDGDLERTRIVEMCFNDRRDQASMREVLPPEKMTILSVAQHHDGGYVAIGGWGDLAGLFRISGEGQVTPILPLKEWVLGIQPSLEKDRFYLWQHVGSGYSLRRLSLTSALTASTVLRENSLIELGYRTWSGWKSYSPPFVRYAKRVLAGKRALVRDQEPESDLASSFLQDSVEQNILTTGTSEPRSELVVNAAEVADSEQKDRESQVGDSPSNSDKNASTSALPSIQESALPWEEAPYVHEHWFTYPQARPSFFGGPSIGLVSVPFRDEMERYQVTIIGDYSFDTERTSLTASFASRRVFEELRLDLFSRERFNGLYYRFPCAVDGLRFQCVTSSPQRGGSGYFHYLRENGGKISTTISLRPSSTLIGLGLSIADISPSIGVRFPEIGPQFLTLATLNGSLMFKLLDQGFYMGEARRPGRSVLAWRSVLELNADENFSLGGVQDGTGQGISTQPDAHFQNANIGLASSLSYLSNRLTLRGELGKSFGEDDLNRRQVFSPYRTYLLGSGSELNRLNVPIFGSRELFGYVAGDWMYRLTLDYARPLFSNLNTRLTVLFLESIDVEAVLGRGGVAYGDDFAEPTAIDSLSGALRFNLDIKGFKIFPALAVGKVLDSDSWSLFAEVSFSDFF